MCTYKSFQAPLSYTPNSSLIHNVNVFKNFVIYVIVEKEFTIGGIGLANDNLSSTEQFVWKFIQDNLESVPFLSIIELSERANVSTATIIRALRKKDFTGFSDFKHGVAKNNSSKDFTNLERADSDIKSAILKNEHEVTNTIKMINIPDIEQSVQRIKHAKTIYIFARGFSELIAKELLVKLQLLNKNCQLSDDPNIIRTLSADIRPGNLVIIISLNGETPELIEAAKKTSKNKIPIILITTNADSTIGKYSTIELCGFKSETTYFPAFEVHSRLPLQVISRVLLDSYVIRTQK